MPQRFFDASPYLLLSLTSLFWSLNWVIGRAIVGHVSPFALACIRWVVAVAVMLPVAWPEIRALARDPSPLAHHRLARLLGNGAAQRVRVHGPAVHDGDERRDPQQLHPD